MTLRLLRLLFVSALPLWSQLPEPDGRDIQAGTLPGQWITGGPNCIEVPDFQIHEYNPDFYILRQSGCLHYEKPFLYLFIGSARALLVDTGAGPTPVVPTVMGVLAKWAQRQNRAVPPLVVTHSHNHGDHTSGDDAFRAAPGVTVVGADLESVRSFFGFRDWPRAIVEFDLGGRVLDVIGIPGHETASIALYDRQTAVLLTGDTVYPGRLYVREPAVFAESIHRLVEFTRERPVAHVLGCHIEQSATPFVEFPVGTTYQPNEHRLELTRAHLLELDDALHTLGPDLRRYAVRDFTIYPVTRSPNRTPR